MRLLAIPEKIGPVSTGLALLVLALLCLLPGIVLPVMTLTGTVDKAELVTLGKTVMQDSGGIMPMLGDMAASLLDSLATPGELVVYDKTRSIVGTVKDLVNSGNLLVGFLVLLFSIIVPVLKISLMLAAHFSHHPFFAGPGQRFAQLISKWSMVDVFVIAIMVAYLAVNASGGNGEVVLLQAHFQLGFYFFLSYCVLSIASAQLLERGQRAHEPEETAVC